MDWKKKIFNGDVFLGVIILAVCIWFYVNGQKLASVKLGGSIDAGFFPRVLAMLIGLMAIGLIIQGIKNGNDYFGNADKASKLLFYETIAIVGAYVFLWQYITFIPLTIALLLALSFCLKINWKAAIPYAVIMSCGLYYIFANVFKIILD